MHRYVVGGILDDLRAGQRVLVAALGADATTLLFLQVAEQVLLEPDAHLFRVYRARGQQRITVRREGSHLGLANFHTLRSVGDFVEGMLVDVAVIDCDDDQLVRRAMQWLGPAMLIGAGDLVRLSRPLQD